jgi:hypothetical protein
VPSDLVYIFVTGDYVKLLSSHIDGRFGGFAKGKLSQLHFSFSNEKFHSETSSLNNSGNYCHPVVNDVHVSYMPYERQRLRRHRSVECSLRLRRRRERKKAAEERAAAKAERERTAAAERGGERCKLLLLSPRRRPERLLRR